MRGRVPETPQRNLARTGQDVERFRRIRLFDLLGQGDEYSVCRAENRRRANLAGSGTDPDRAEMVGLYGRYHGDQSG